MVAASIASIAFPTPSPSRGRRETARRTSSGRIGCGYPKCSVEVSTPRLRDPIWLDGFFAREKDGIDCLVRALEEYPNCKIALLPFDTSQWRFSRDTSTWLAVATVGSQINYQCVRGQGLGGFDYGGGWLWILDHCIPFMIFILSIERGLTCQAPRGPTRAIHLHFRSRLRVRRPYGTRPGIRKSAGVQPLEICLQQ